LTNLTLQRTALGAIINIILNFLLIPHYTVVGAAIATVISQAFASYFSHAFHPRTMKLFLLQTRSFLLFN
jgi:polysaccharide transporter, PST family